MNNNINKIKFNKNIISYNELTSPYLESEYNIFNLEDQYVRRTKIGKFGIIEIPHEDFAKVILECENNVLLHTNYKELLVLKNKKSYTIECEGVIRTMWLCKIISFEEAKDIGVFTEEDKLFYEEKSCIQYVNVIYGRCINSMTFLDKVHREYLYKHKFKNGEIIAVKSVAGSGKTTTLLELAKNHSKKRILYIAFNKSLISEIKDKIKERGLKNMFPVTFDSLMRTVFIIKTKIDNEHLSIIDLKPQNLGFYIDWFANKPYNIKNFYIKCYNKFCNQTKYCNIKDFSERILGGDKGLLTKMWQKTLDHDMLTFDSIRKLVEINNWCKGYIDANYDMIFIDESQDFDNIMLKILLEDTTIPKLFVGDTRQAIYEWKGCINAFDKLPDHSLILEFYSTFRVGLPACDEIREKFEHCYMISKSSNVTVIEYDTVPNEKYTYLFRSWKNLLQTASITQNIWIHNFNNQIIYIKKLHNKLQISPLDKEEYNEFSDDLPKFLLKLTAEELEKMINNIEKNIVKKEDCVVELYTIHSYKGLENNIIRIFNDIDIAKEQNLYYVALTRGMKKIIIDNKKVIFDYDYDNNSKKQLFFKKVGINSIILE